MSKNIKKQENLFISTQQDATQAQMMVPSDQLLNFQVEETFKCPLYFADKPEWVDDLNKASDPIIARLKKNWKKKIKDPKDPTTGLPNSYHSELLWQYPEFQTIANLILQQSWNILAWQGYNLTGRKPLMTELWVQEVPEEGGFHDIHEHGNNHISGFYFLKASQYTSRPLFQDPRTSHLGLKLKEKDKTKVTLGCDIVNYNISAGSLMLFPAYLSHAYAVDHGIEPFRFIHVNIRAIEKDLLKSYK